MSVKAEDGLSQRQHLERDADGLVPNPLSRARLDEEPPLPPSMASVWAIFLEMHSRRQQSMDGPVRWAWTEIEAYSRMRLPLRGWKLTAIFAVENAFFEVRAEATK